MRVKTARWEPPMKPIKDIESLCDKRNVKKAAWIGVRVTEFQPVRRFIDHPLSEMPGLLGIMYHTQRANWHPSGNGLNGHFPELLYTERPTSKWVMAEQAASALLVAEARVEYLREQFPDKEIDFTLPGPFTLDVRTETGFREVAVPPEDLEMALNRAGIRRVSPDDPFQQ